MTTSQHQVYPSLYKDSVGLMAITAALSALEGIEAASVVMATEANRANLSHAGLTDDSTAGPNDLLVVVRGEPQACSEALELADRLLTEQLPEQAAVAQARTPTSLRVAAPQYPESSLALISVPGQYAAAEALKALQLGLDVMLFSDNVPVSQEVEVKRYAEEHGLLVMGPDCGTAMVNGIPLGFANVVRRGSIGVVGASGTGMQEVTCRIHQLGAGVSQALGTGGHDLSAQVGGISTLRGLQALDDDPTTEVVVLVSKPPAEEVAATVLEAAESMITPVVVMFVGAAPESVEATGVQVATTLAEAADLAVAIATGGEPQEAPPAGPDPHVQKTLERLSPDQRYVRGVFSGGTFCYETQALCQAQGIHAASNTPIADNPALEDVWTSTGDTIVDMGDDVFTQGRPHPMIDPTLRNERVLAELTDPATAVLVLDVVLGYGAAEHPISGLLGILEQGRSAAGAQGRFVPVIAHVCGTDQDPQDRSAVIDQLCKAGVLVADSNAQASRWAAALVCQLTPPERN